MKFIAKLIITLIINAIALYAAARFIEGFSMQESLEAYIKVAAALTLISALAKPVLKVVLSPLIIITFGLGIIVVNALILYGLDLLMADLTISGLFPLVYATLLISVVNSVLSLGKSAATKHSEE